MLPINITFIIHKCNSEEDHKRKLIWWEKLLRLHRQHEDWNTEVNHQPHIIMLKHCFFAEIYCKLIVLFLLSKWVTFCKHTLGVEILQYFARGLISLPHYLGDSPPWEQLVGEVKGLVLLLECREGVRPRVLLGEPWHRSRKTGISNVLQCTGRSTATGSNSASVCSKQA